MIKFCKPSLGVEEEQAVLEVIRSGWLASGEKTKQFEEEFAKYVGVKYAIFTNSGTSALKMAYKIMKESGVKNLAIPKNTFCATYSAAIENGLEWNITFDLWEPSFGNLEHRVNVHYGGVKDLNGCYLEDSAHRIEANDPLIGKIRVYSFYVTKNLTTGAGGMFVTNDESIYKKARIYWNDGIDKNAFDRQHGGWNYRVVDSAGGYDGNDIAASIGIEQLKKLPEFTKRRNTIRDIYNRKLGQTWEGNHLYPYFVETEEQVGKLIEYLKDNDIQASYHYPGTGWLGVSLPIYPDLSSDEQFYIIKKVQEFK